MRDTVWCILVGVSFVVGYVAGRHDASGSEGGDVEWRGQISSDVRRSANGSSARDVARQVRAEWE